MRTHNQWTITACSEGGFMVTCPYDEAERFRDNRGFVPTYVATSLSDVLHFVEKKLAVPDESKVAKEPLVLPLSEVAR